MVAHWRFSLRNRSLFPRRERFEVFGHASDLFNADLKPECVSKLPEPDYHDIKLRQPLYCTWYLWLSRRK